MKKILTAGRYIFPLSFFLYIGLHLGKPETGAGFVPHFIPFPLFWNYLTAVFILLFIVGAVIKKYDGLAYTLMALYVLLMAFVVHLPRAMGYETGMEAMAGTMEREKELEMVNVFQNIMVTGAMMAFARYVAKDKRFIGRNEKG